MQTGAALSVYMYLVSCEASMVTEFHNIDDSPSHVIILLSNHTTALEENFTTKTARNSRQIIGKMSKQSMNDEIINHQNRNLNFTHLA